MIDSVVFYRSIVFLPIPYVFKPFFEKAQIIVKINWFEPRFTKKNPKIGFRATKKGLKPLFVGIKPML